MTPTDGVPERTSSDAGFTLVEVVVAMVLLAILALATLPMFARGIQATASTGTTTTATQAVGARIEQARTADGCDDLTGQAAVPWSRTDAHGHSFQVSLSVTGCAPGKAAQVRATATAADGHQLATAATMVFVAP